MKNSNKNILNLFAYVALVIVAFLLLLRMLSSVITLGGTIINILESLQNILVLIVIGISAYKFSKANNRKWIRILYWISVAVFVVGTVLIWL